MKVAAAAAILAAFILGLSVSGVIGRTPTQPPADPIELRSGAADTVSPSPSPTAPGGAERVGMRVKEEELDDHGGRRRDAERAEDGSGRGSDDSAVAEPAETSTPRMEGADEPRSENSGRGSSNSGSGSANSGRDDGD